MRILVVEDEWLIAAMVVNALHSTQHEVVGPVPSVEAGLWLVQHHAGLALLDINLGRGDNGVDLARCLHQRHGIPVSSPAVPSRRRTGPAMLRLAC